MMIFGTVLVFLVGPWMSCQSLTVDSKGFSISGFLVQDERVRFDDLKSIRFRWELSGVGENQTWTEFMYFHHGSGRVVKIEKSRLPSPVFERIIRFAEEKAIPMPHTGRE